MILSHMHLNPPKKSDDGFHLLVDLVLYGLPAAGERVPLAPLAGATGALTAIYLE